MMLRFVLPLLALCCAPLSASAAPANARASNVAPLAFGMTQQEVFDALGTRLVLFAVQRRGGEIYVADRDAGVPGYPVGEHLLLQFRRGLLTGWKKDWAIRPHGPF